MKIHFEQSGGFVAGVRRPPIDIDTSTLHPNEATAWHDLVTAADFFNLPATTPAGPGRDLFSYLITVESEGKLHTIQAQGDSIPPEVSLLIERLRQVGLRQAK